MRPSGMRTARDIPACSAVPQPSASPRKKCKFLYSFCLTRTLNKGC